MISSTSSSGYLGSLAQQAGIDRFSEEEGPGRGARRIRAYTGGGLEFEVHPDRAFDIGRVTFRGVGVSWLSPTRITAPGLVVNQGYSWLQTFGGGLLTTCGLDTIGEPSDAGGQSYSQHGRVGSIPATLTRATVDSDELVLEAEIRQASVHGENLVLVRRISAEVGGTSFRISDTVTNQGRESQAHMILYHCNIGWPLLGEDVRLKIPAATSVTGENPAARQATEPWDSYGLPSVGAESLVYRHHITQSGIVTATMANPAVDTSLAISFDTATLPHLHQWKMTAPSQYLLGIEPSNSPTLAGRSTAEDDGRVPILLPGESVSYDLEFAFGSADV